MLRWSLLFLIFALVAAFLGFSNLAADAGWIAKILFVVFLLVAAVSFVFDHKAPAT